MKYLYQLKSILILLFFVGCKMLSPEDYTNGDRGNVNLNLSTNSNVINVSYGRQASTDVSAYVVEIRNQLGALVKYYENSSEMPSSIELPNGNYIIEAFSTIDFPNAEFESPYYSGSTDFEVTGGNTTNVDIECVLSNVKVSVNFDSDFDVHFKDYKVTNFERDE